GVDDVPRDCAALRLELGAGCSDVWDPDRDARRRGRELLSDARRIEDVEGHLAKCELEIAVALALDREAERLAVELLRTGDVLRQHGHEVDLLDLQDGGVPSSYGA